jgi:hypothetical protein
MGHVNDWLHRTAQARRTAEALEAAHTEGVRQIARRRAELDAAAVGTRDGVVELTAAVEALRATTARSSRVMIVLTGVLVVLTVALVALTVVLVLG